MISPTEIENVGIILTLFQASAGDIKRSQFDKNFIVCEDYVDSNRKLAIFSTASLVRVRTINFLEKIYDRFDDTYNFFYKNGLLVTSTSNRNSTISIIK